MQIEVINTGDQIRVIQAGEVLGAYTIGFIDLFTAEQAEAAGAGWWPQVLDAAQAGPGAYTYRVQCRFHRLLNQ